MKLKKDIVVPAGTTLHPAPAKTERGSRHLEALVSLSNDVVVHITFCPDDLTEEEWNEVISTA